MATVHPTAFIEPGGELDRDVQVGPYAVIGPDVRIGARTLVGDHTYGLNVVGLRRHGCSSEVLRELKEAYRIVFAADLNTSQALARLEAAGRCSPEVQFFIDFIKRSQRGIGK